MSEFATPQAGRLLMGLYPAAYRAAHGADIEAVFAEAAEGLTRRQVLRERRDLAKHALRLRLRIGPTDPAGRVLAGAAPVVLAVFCGLALHELIPQVPELVQRFRQVYPVHGLLAAMGPAAVLAALTVPLLSALVLAVLGRWRAARTFGALGAFAEAGLALLLFGHIPLAMAGAAVGPLFGGLLLLLAPAPLVNTGRRGRWEVTGLAMGIGLPLIATDLFRTVSPDSTTGLRAMGLQPLWQYVAVAVLLAVHLSARRPDLFRAAGIALGVAPWLLFIPFGLLSGPHEYRYLLRFVATSLTPFGIALAIALVARLVHRSRRAGRPAGSA